MNSRLWLMTIFLTNAPLTAPASQLDTINALKPGEWYEVSNSKMSGVVPCPARDCAYSGIEGPGAVIWSWSGGVYDRTRDRLVVWGGGHGAYAGNEIYAFDMNALSWTRVTEPSSIDGYTNGPVTYPDGRPVSVHSYDQIEYDPVADRMFVFGGSRYSSGSNSTAAFTFNFDSKQWTQVTSIPGDPYSETIGLSLNSAYDPETKRVLIGGAWSLTTYDVATDTWKLLNKNYGGWELPNGLTATLDPKRRQFVQIGRGHAFIWDISAAAPERKNLATSGANEIEQCDSPGLDYDPVSDRIAAWCAGSDVYTLNLDTKVWTKITATNAVTPGDPRYEDPIYGLQYHGTFGRFRYVPSKNLFVVVTDMDRSVYVYKLADGAGQTPTTALALSASASAVDSGRPVTLTWEAFNADLCTASGAWSGNKKFSDSEVIASITSSSMFSLSCSYGGNTPVVRSVSVAVNGSPASTGTNTRSTSGALGAELALLLLVGMRRRFVTAIRTLLGVSLAVLCGCQSASSSNQQAVSVSLTASPASVPASGTSTLSWSSTNASSCTASGGWSGAKSSSGSETLASLASTADYALTCAGDGGSDSESVTITVVAATQYPTPSGNSLTMPSAADEAVTYRKWKWTWNSSVEPGAVSEPISTPYVIANPDIHHDTEGDDLWTYIMMYRRSGNPVYLARAAAWARYFKEDYRLGIGNDYYGTLTFDGDEYEYDHMYGWGLVTWYEHTALAGAPDDAALAEAEQLATVVETLWNRTNPDGTPRYVAGKTTMAEYGQRRGARHLLLVTRVAEATRKQRWATLRDKLVDLWLQSPDWEWTDAEHTTGMYYYGAWDTNESVAPTSDCKYTNATNCPYQQGARVISPFQIGILTEAFDQAYRTTGNTALVDRMVALARFADKYGLDPTYDYTASRLGFVDGKLWHNYSANGPTTWWDPVYTTSLVNTLVRGYKYTGDRRFYARAQHFFNRGTKGEYGSITPVAADDVAHHFVDTRFASSTENVYLSYNKGELQYTYLLFENGGLTIP